MREWTLRIAVLVALLVATVSVTRVGRAQVRLVPRESVGALPAIPFLECVSLGYRELAADLAWIQAVQYYGEFRQGGNDLSEFDHYLRAVNTLDPYYEHAYILGAFVLATDGHDVDAAVELLRRGARALPESHRIPFEMAFLTYVMGGDVDAAVHYFGFAATKPGGRERALRFQAFLNRRLGRLESAWVLWNDLYRNTDNPSLKIVAKESLKRIEAALRERDEHKAREEQPASVPGTPPAEEGL